MFDESFLNNMLIISEDYKEVQDAVKSFDALVTSISSLQDDLLEEIKRDLSTDTIELSVKRLESVQLLGSYRDCTIGNLMNQMSATYAAELFEGDECGGVLKESFIEEISNHTLYLDDELS